MDAFIDRVIEQFRHRVWELLARGPASAAGASDEARRVHRTLRGRDWRDLTRDPEGHMFLAVADVLNAFDSQRRLNNQDQTQDQDKPNAESQRSAAPRDEPSASQKAAAGEPSMKPIVARLRSELNDLSPVCRATLILRRRERMSLEEIARRLHLQVPEVEQHLKAGILQCAAGRLYRAE